MSGLSKGPRFTVLLPTHNRADVLSYAVESVLAQHVAEFELFIVGDGCTDATAEVVARFSDPRIRWFDLPKAPSFGYANRNRALREARGQWVAYMTHDDIWLPDHLALLHDALQRSGAAIAYTRPLWVMPDGRLTPSTFDLNQREIRDPFLARRRNSIPSSCVAHRRDCFERVGWWHETLPTGADLDLWARIIESGGGFAYVPIPTALHFRANWRTDANSGPRELRAWRILHDVEGFFPPDMRITVTAGRPEQAAAWAMLVADPDGWTARLRAAVAQSIDWRITLADELVLAIERTCGPGEVHRLAVAPSELAARAHELEKIKASHSRRMAQSIYQVVSLFASAGRWLERALFRPVKRRILAMGRRNT
jgi:glycosyltransferase involved in cell wall biosynthesis